MGALDGQVALVTGPGMGIGQAIALERARQGATVCYNRAPIVDGHHIYISRDAHARRQLTR